MFGRWTFKGSTRKTEIKGIIISSGIINETRNRTIFSAWLGNACTDQWRRSCVVVGCCWHWGRRLMPTKVKRPIGCFGCCCSYCCDSKYFRYRSRLNHAINQRETRFSISQFVYFSNSLFSPFSPNHPSIWPSFFFLSVYSSSMILRMFYSLVCWCLRAMNHDGIERKLLKKIVGQILYRGVRNDFKIISSRYNRSKVFTFLAIPK